MSKDKVNFGQDDVQDVSKDAVAAKEVETQQETLQAEDQLEMSAEEEIASLYARIVELEQALAATETELADYKQRVTEEFTDTAEKFRALNRGYEDLHRQLAKSANALCGEAGVPTLLDYAATPALQEPSADPIDSDTKAADVVPDRADLKTTASIAPSETESELSDAALESADAAASATALQDTTTPVDRP